MKTKYFAILLILAYQVGFAQKNKVLISNITSGSWEKLGDYEVSRNGKFICYSYGKDRQEQNIVLCSGDKKYYKEFLGEARGFSKDGNYFVFSHFYGNTIKIGIVTVGTNNVSYLENVDRFDYTGIKSDFILYFIKDGAFLQKLGSKVKIYYPNVKNTYFNRQGSAMVIRRSKSLIYRDLYSGKEVIFSGDTTADNIVFNESGKEVAFTTRDNKGVKVNYWSGFGNKTVIILDNQSNGLQNNYFIKDYPLTFDTNSNRLWLKLDYKPANKRDTTVISSNVNIWGYKDSRLQSNQAFLLKNDAPPSYSATVELSSRKFVQIEDQDSVIIGQPKGDYVVLSKRGNNFEAYWNESERSTYDLLSIKTGKRVAIADSQNVSTGGGGIAFSPTGRFLVWFDISNMQHCSYEIPSGLYKSISKGISYPLNITYQQSGEPSAWSSPLNIWTKDDEKVFIYDEFDIWEVDPRGSHPPVNRTGGFGRKHNIEFRFAKTQYPYSILSKQQSCILRAVQKDSYDNGFWTIVLGKDKLPIKRCMEPYIYTADLVGGPPQLLKAQDADVYLITRQSATEAPNLFISQDLRTFTKISNLSPQRPYNWMKSELISYKLPNGMANKCILYKPENFDSTKKYPVIFNYYQYRSNELHLFHNPKLSNGELSIPWYVSNGYLVCVVDIINNIPGKIASVTLNSVESAAKYLNTLPYVDSLKYGIQGHSFGGYETNLLAAFSKMFAAAQSSAGAGDLISQYGDLRFGDRSNQAFVEMGQVNMGYPMLDNLEGYISSSPVFSAKKICTPILLQNNTSDGDLWRQGVEMFTALRRYKKPVWMIQYDNEGHTISGEKEMLDFTVRQQQFFNHFLKDEPAPSWMTRGIAFKDKGIKSGLALDTPGNHP